LNITPPFSHVEPDIFIPGVWYISSEWFSNFQVGLPYNRGVSILKGRAIGLEMTETHSWICPRSRDSQTYLLRSIDRNQLFLQ